MQAIHTKYMPATNTRSSRIKASCAAHSITVAYDHELDVEDNHKAACFALQIEMVNRGGAHWRSPMESGCLPDGSYAHVFIPF
jgi:hypothetical protein